MSKTRIAGNSGPLFDHAAVAGQSASFYSKTATNSWEQIFSPINIAKDLNSATPGFRAPGATSENGPFGGSAVGPTIAELDPYFSVILGDDGSSFFPKTDYRFISTISGGSMPTNLNKDELEDTSSVSAVRTNALRGPIILSGWGFGIDDLPVPQGNTKTTINASAIGNRALWKTGPVNLMWDDERQVWQGGYHVVCGVATGEIEAPTSPCDPKYFGVKIFRNMNDANGKISTVLGETITVANRDPSLTQEEAAGAIFVVAIRINYEWIPLWVGCPEGPATSDCVV